MLTGGLTYISPENYHQNLLKGVLEHILHKYREGIVAFPNSIELRISLSYVLNDLALLKNEALTTAHYCQDLDFSLLQGVKIKSLIKYLEEEEIYHERGLGAKIQEGTSHKVTLSKQDSSSDNIFITSKQIDVKTYQKRMTLKRKFFVMRVMKSLSKYEDFWKELSLETPDSSKVKLYLAKYYTEYLLMEEFIKKNQGFLQSDTQAIFYYSIYQNLALGETAQAERTLSRGREIISKQLVLKFDPKNLTLNMDLGECDKPMMYVIRNGTSSLKIVECNLSFCWSVMLKKSDLKNRNFLNLVPADLHTKYKGTIRSMLKENTPERGEFIFKYRTDSIRKYSFQIKVSSLLKLSH